MQQSLGKGDGCELPARAVHRLSDDPQPGISTWWLSGGPDNVPFVFDVRSDLLTPTDRQPPASR
ncbi:hypothetical protein NBRGN_026_00530 [Nocardia brasiliensis NBRC 14402]|uniref:hypothetical protein n=1 Tax=Nocardia brasiliensis TaxID=37326 RepID=UPI0002EEB086|nr:hypothetical protein [Nocardia brasiliensis]GAJ80300.1 hypothetical protein NBRGN_026_00530 [Nocardia brasiliensis NBRC 14402]